MSEKKIRRGAEECIVNMQMARIPIFNFLILHSVPPRLCVSKR